MTALVTRTVLLDFDNHYAIAAYPMAEVASNTLSGTFITVKIDPKYLAFL